MITIFVALITKTGPLFDVLYTTSGLSVTCLTDNIEPVINDAMAIISRLTRDFGTTGLDSTILTCIYPLLTQIMQDFIYLVNLVQHYISYSLGSSDLNQLQDLFNRLFDTARSFLSVYRQVEEVMNIPLASSPVSTQAFGF